nr:uncharacterized protein LOC119162217 [Rhipicephalus microplus]
MSLVLYCAFKAIENIDARFQPPALEKGHAQYDNDHVYGVKKVNTDIEAKCLSQQSRHAYDVDLQVSITPLEILRNNCTCRYGALSNCKLCAAVALYVNLHEDASCMTGSQTGKSFLQNFGGMRVGSGALHSHYWPVKLSEVTTVLKPWHRCTADVVVFIMFILSMYLWIWYKERKVRISSTGAHTILHTRRGPKHVLHSILKSSFFFFFRLRLRYMISLKIRGSKQYELLMCFIGICMEPVARKNFEQQHGVTVTGVLYPVGVDDAKDVLLYTDAAAYMHKAADLLKTFCPQMTAPPVKAPA